MTRRNKLAIIIALVTMVTSLATLLLLLKKKEKEKEEEINQLADDFVDNYDECNYDEIYREFASSYEPTEDINVPPITEE